MPEKRETMLTGEEKAMMSPDQLRAALTRIPHGDPPIGGGFYASAAIQSALTSAEALRAAEQENIALRKFAWLWHGCPINALYGDDGELSCGRCGLEFKRGDPNEWPGQFHAADARAVANGRPSLLRPTEQERDALREEYEATLRDIEIATSMTGGAAGLAAMLRIEMKIKALNPRSATKGG